MPLFGILIVVLTCSLLAKADTAAQIILQKKSAISVSPVRLYADSSFSKTTETTYTEGELFEIIAETVKEYPDNAQNQTFKWFKIKTLTGKIGWIFGDNLAVVLNESALDIQLKPFNKKEAHFDNGFENALIWFGTVEGHDEKNRDINPSYKEFYLIITNDKGKSVSLNLSNINESGKKTLENIYFQDVTNNKIDDIIIQTHTLPSDKNLAERDLEIYTFKAGALSKIFEERLALTWEDDVPSPALSKFIDIEGSEIRVAYIDYVLCEKYSLGLPTDVRSKTMERCLQYVTYSFIWNNGKKAFEPFYKESRTPVSGIVIRKITLNKVPSVSSEKAATILADDKVLIIKHFDALKSEKGIKKVENWLYVKHLSGVYGYMNADDLVFKNVEHATVLKNYYSKTPLLKQDWKSDAPFVTVKK